MSSTVSRDGSAPDASSRSLHAGEEVAAPQLARRHVEGDVRAQAAGRPRELLGADRLQHPVAERVDQPGLLGHGDELAGGDHPVLGVLPAQQRLERDELAGPQAEDRLVVQAQLVARQCAPQPGLDRVVGRRLADRAGGPGPDLPAALDQRGELPRHHPVAVDRVGGPLGAQQVRLGAADERAGVLVGEQHPAVAVERQQRRLGGVHPAPRARRGRLRPALQVLRELAADRGEHRRDLRVGLAHPVRVELDHARAAVADRDRERHRGHQPRARAPSRRAARSAWPWPASPTTGAGTPTRAPAGPARRPARRGSTRRRARRPRPPRWPGARSRRSAARRRRATASRRRRS